MSTQVTPIPKFPTYRHQQGYDTYKVMCSWCHKPALVIGVQKMCCNNPLTQQELNAVYVGMPFNANKLHLDDFFKAGVHTATKAQVAKLLRTKKSAWLYLFHIGGNYFYKIGISRQPMNRLNAIRQAHLRKLNLPRNIKPEVFVVHQVMLEDARTHERNLHRTYGDFRHYGEYYRLRSSHIKEIVRLMNLVHQQDLVKSI